MLIIFTPRKTSGFDFAKNLIYTSHTVCMSVMVFFFNWILIFLRYILNYVSVKWYDIMDLPQNNLTIESKSTDLVTSFVEVGLFIIPSFSSVQFSRSVVSDSATPWIAARQASLSITNSRSSPRLTSIESVMPCSHLILCRPLLLGPQSLPASESFPMSQLFAWGDHSTEVSASFLPKNTQGWSPLEWTGTLFTFVYIFK